MYISSIPNTDRDMLELHRIVNDAQVRQRHAASLQKLDVQAATTKAPAERAGNPGTAAAGRKLAP